MKAATVTGIYGTAGGGLTNATWAANNVVAAIGQRAEQRTADLLKPFGKQTAIIHDVRVPIPGFTSNIDHIVVSGKTVYLIDTKAWKAGVYWSLAGTNMTGLRKAAPSVSKSPDYAVRAFQQHLGPEVTVRPVVLGVWPSKRGGKVTLLNPAVYNCKVIPAPKLISHLGLKRSKPGHAPTVNKLKKLAN